MSAELSPERVAPRIRNVELFRVEMTELRFRPGGCRMIKAVAKTGRAAWRKKRHRTDPPGSPTGRLISPASVTG